MKRHPYRYPIRPASLYPAGSRITTRHGIFECIIVGAADQWGKGWARVQGEHGGSGTNDA